MRGVVGFNQQIEMNGENDTRIKQQERLDRALAMTRSAIKAHGFSESSVMLSPLGAAIFEAAFGILEPDDDRRDYDAVRGRMDSGKRALDEVKHCQDSMTVDERAHDSYMRNTAPIYWTGGDVLRAWRTVNDMQMRKV